MKNGVCVGLHALLLMLFLFADGGVVLRQRIWKKKKLFEVC